MLWFLGGRGTSYIYNAAFITGYRDMRLLDLYVMANTSVTYNVGKKINTFFELFSSIILYYHYYLYYYYYIIKYRTQWYIKLNKEYS